MVRPLLSAVLLASFTLLPACNALPKGYGGAQPLHVSRQLGTSNMTSAERANAVKDAFQFAWDGYYTYAFPHDDLLPVSDGFSDPRYVSELAVAGSVTELCTGMAGVPVL